MPFRPNEKKIAKVEMLFSTNSILLCKVLADLNDIINNVSRLLQNILIQLHKAKLLHCNYT